MLSEEVTIGIYPEGELNDVLIVPDGHEYHLFLTGTHSHLTVLKKALNLGSIVFVNNNWIYEGSGLSEKSQKEIADYIMSYPGDEEHSALM
jgi:hypothetical protein